MQTLFKEVSGAQRLKTRRVRIRGAVRRLRALTPR